MFAGQKHFGQQTAVRCVKCAWRTLTCVKEIVQIRCTHNAVAQLHVIIAKLDGSDMQLQVAIGKSHRAVAQLHSTILNCMGLHYNILHNHVAIWLFP